MSSTVPEAVACSGLLRGGLRVFAACSGGADSTALLLALAELREQIGFTLCAVHVNHALRGAESDRDQQFCEALCARLNVPLTVRRVDVRAAAANAHCSLETAARQLRYEVFAAVATADNDRVATAHNASDHTETVLLNLTRGTGLAGLCGIPRARGRFIRPLLSVPREALLAYLAAQEQPYVTDSSNSTDFHTRNRLRHHVLPLLRAENPALDRTVGAMTDILREEQDYLASQAAQAFAACHTPDGALAGLLQLHPAIRRRCIALFLQTAGVEQSYVRICAAEQLLEAGGSQLLTPDRRLTSTDGVLRISRVTAPVAPVAQPLQIGENRVFSGKICTASLRSDIFLTNDANIHNMFTNNMLDYDKIVGVAVFRARARKDRFSLPGRGFSTEARKLVQARIPVPERAALHCLADDAGLIWIEHIGAAARVCPDLQTRRTLILTVTTDPKDKE